MAEPTVATAPGSCELNKTLNRSWAMQVKPHGAEDSKWIFMRGAKSINPTISTSSVDASDIDSNGFESQVKTARKFVIAVKGAYARVGAEADLEASIKLLRDAGMELGDAGVIDARVWRTDGTDEGWEASVSVEFKPDDGDANALRSFTADLQAKCQPQRIKPVQKGAEMKASVPYTPAA